MGLEGVKHESFDRNEKKEKGKENKRSESQSAVMCVVLYKGPDGPHA